MKPTSEQSPVVGLFDEFLRSEKASGLILFFCILVSLLIANSVLKDQYIEFWHLDIGRLDLLHWINDGLMTLFFLLIGLELEREIYVGELSNLRSVRLPVSAAIGGMVFPSILYLIFNFNTPFQNGFGIPMATDIAFAIAILSVIRKQIPLSLKVFVTALAIVDDLISIIIIALFYSKTIYFTNLAVSLLTFGFLIFLNKIRVYHLLPYLAGGAIMWYFMLQSGIHPAISGVLLAFAIPFKRKDSDSPSFRLEHYLNRPVTFIILPLFALANTAISFKGINMIFTETYTIGIMAGLIIGKPLGILGFSFLSVKMKLADLPDELNWRMIGGAGCIAGIGFTMSVFITLLSFTNEAVIENAKIAVLVASFISAMLGVLVISLKRRNQSHPG